MGDERKTMPVGDGTTVVSGVGARIDVARRVGGRVGAVVLEKQIGEGGMGVVWRGRHEILGREVAVKFLTEAVEEGDPGFAAFVEGARACAAVRHEGLVEVFDAGVVLIEPEASAGGGLARGEGKVDGQEGIRASGGGASGINASSGTGARLSGSSRVPYLVMELVDGQGLDHVIRVCGALSLGATLAVMEQVCSAIGELHAAGFVHRDIKPGNILLDAEGRVHVTDFGLACERSGVRGQRPREAGPGSGLHISGTPVYMAPEMFQGEVSARSDVYALAVMMYELLTGDVPFRGEVLEVKRLHEGAEVPRAGLEAKGVPAAVIEVIERGMVKSAMVRPRSAAHWLESLRAVVRDRDAWEGGARALKGLVVKARGEAVRGEGTGDSTSYYKTIAERAEEKRKIVIVEGPEGPGLPTPEAARCECGYALKGLRTTGKCPECGGLIAASLSKMSLPCVSCGYDLVGIDERGKCPECGRDVEESVRPSRLMFADEAWLKRTATGLGLLAVGLALVPLLMLVIAILTLLVMGMTTQGAMGSAIGIGMAFGLVTSVVLVVIGVLNATVREPGIHGSAAAPWVRWAFLAGMGLILGSAVTEMVEPRFPERILLLPGLHLVLIGVVLLGAFVERLGERIPDRKLRRVGRSVFWPWVLLVFMWFAIGMADNGWMGIGSTRSAVQALSAGWFFAMIFAVAMAANARKHMKAVARVAVRRADREQERVSVRWQLRPGAMAAAVAVFIVIAVPVFLLAPLAQVWTYELADRLGVLEPMSGPPGNTIVMEGKEYRGQPPLPMLIMMAMGMVMSMYIVPLVLALGVYLWMGVEREGSIWRRELWNKLAAAGAVYLVILGLVVAGVARPLAISQPRMDVPGILTILVIHVPPLVFAMLVLHGLVLRMDARRR